MNNRGLLLISVIFMLFILSISSVSAGEINNEETNLILSNGENSEFVANNEEINNIVTSSEDNVVENIDENNYVDLKENSKDSLSSNILSEPKNITVTNKTFRAIQIAIDGANEGDRIILSGTYTPGNLYVINVNKTISIIGCNNAVLDAIHYGMMFNVTASNVEIENITFKNANRSYSQVRSGVGGAVNGGTVINCTFINNIAVDGGALSGIAINCTFINNTAEECGGAMYLGRATNCTFINNHAGTNGGAVFFDNNHWSTSWTGCTFINNSANNLGGAIYDIGVADITNDSFVNNHAGIDGSAIFIKSGIISFPIAHNMSSGISDCGFINCSDRNIISIQGCPDFYINNLNFIKCNSSNDSSCFIALDNVNSFECFNNSFVNCSFKGTGSILHLNYTFSQNINISSCTFDNNALNDNSSLFYSNHRNIYFDNCSFINHHLYDQAVIRLVNGSSPSNLVNCYFKDNYVYSGAILEFNKNEFPSGTTCYFINNTVSGGSLIFVEDDCSNVSNLYFENNTVNSNSLISFKGENCSISDCSFINNSAKYDGVLNFENVYLCNLVDCYFESNNASNFGGVIYSKNSTLNIERCTFKDNGATKGGAIYSDGKNVTLNVKDSIFEKNTGRSVYTTSDMIMENSTFIDNLGGICLESVLSSLIYNCSFINNTAGEYGDAIYSISSNFTLDKCNFFKHYKALFIDGSDFELNNCYFKNYGEFQDKGGDIVVQYCEKSLINNSVFDGEYGYLPHYGGVSGSCNISNCTFKNYINPPIENSLCVNCLFENNTSIAGVLRYSVAENCTFRNNRGTSYVLDSNVTNCTFINNSRGALVFTIENSYEVINCTFINNSYNYGNGGAISIVNASVNIVNSSFENNTCTGSGGAIFIENSTGVSISSCEFVNCISGDGSESIIIDNLDDLEVFNCVFDVIPEGMIVHYSSILLANDFSFALGSNGILVVNLSDVRGPLVGKIITLTVNGENYTNVTDSDGLTSFNLKNYLTHIGNYTVSVSFDGDEIVFSNFTNVDVGVYNYKGLLTIEKSGKYFEDVNVSFKLINMSNVKPISNANIRVDFSNGEFVNLVTDSDGAANYLLPFAPGTYNLTATVCDESVDVNTVKLNNIIINTIEGEIVITQAENVLNIRLFNPVNGDVYNNVEVTLKFDDMDAFNLTTNNQGIASYDMTELGFGTYNAFVMVTGDYKEFNPKYLDSIIVKNYTIEKTNSQVSFGKAIVFDYGKTGSTTV